MSWESRWVPPYVHMVYVQRLLIIYRYEYEKEIECETLFYEEFDPSSG